MSDRPRPPRLALAALVVAGLLGCDGGGTGGVGPPDLSGPPEGALRVLFVGNSLTATNDLPSMVEQLGPTVDGAPLYVGALAVPNVSLEDHWADGRARSEIASGAWDLVVLQQGPSTLPQSRAHLATWVGRFADDARAHGVAPAVFMVWPVGGTEDGFDAVVSGYTNAAEAADAALFPAGAAWRASIEGGDAVALYGPDGFHPSVEGTYLAALVIAAGVSGRPAVGMPAVLTLPGGTVRIDAGTAEQLQRRADAALAATRAAPAE